METNTHPVARIQDLLDQLKRETCARSEHDKSSLPGLWNELEDLLIMLVKPDTSLHNMEAVKEWKKKADVWDEVLEIIGEINAHTDETNRREDQDRRSDHGDGPIGGREASPPGDTSTKGDRSPPGRDLREAEEGGSA